MITEQNSNGLLDYFTVCFAQQGQCAMRVRPQEGQVADNRQAPWSGRYIATFHIKNEIGDNGQDNNVEPIVVERNGQLLNNVHFEVHSICQTNVLFTFGC